MKSTTIIDRIGLPRAYEAACRRLKPESRLLTADERKLATAWFKDTLPLDRIRIDERSWIGPRQYRFCYVSFCHINSWGPMSASTFIHELVHIWQYMHVGSRYIYLAWKAQASRDGYDYGGLGVLKKHKQARGHLMDFNYEQQAAIIEDAFRSAAGLPMRYARSQNPEDTGVFYYYVQQLWS